LGDRRCGGNDPLVDFVLRLRRRGFARSGSGSGIATKLGRLCSGTGLAAQAGALQALAWPTLESWELFGGAVYSRRVRRLVLAVPRPGWARGSPRPMFPIDCALAVRGDGCF
jgi:hypothetical protein